MMGNSVRIGVIGVGLWGARAHIPALLACDEVEVVAVADPDAERAESVAEQFGVRHVFGGGHELLNGVDKLDAVVIATPTDTHHDLVVAACGRGVHILCEKPLAYDVAQARDLVQALDARRLIGKLGFLFRFSPAIQRMKQLIDDGYIGEIQLIEVLTINAQFMDPIRPLHWKMQRSRANGGVFVEYGAHSIDLALWLAGPISRLVAHGVTLIQERPTDGTQTAVVTMDDTASWITEHQGGAQGLFRTGWASLPIGGGGLRVYGTSGSLAWHLDPTGRQQESLLASTIDEPEIQTLLEFSASAARTQGEESFPLGLLADYDQRLVRSFVDDIRRGRGTDPSFADGFEAQKVLSAIRTSLDEHHWVELDTE